MNNLKIIFFMFATLFCLPINAQESMEERVNNVENTVARLPRIIGNINLRYQYDDRDAANGFDVRRARLDFRGNVTKPVEYRIHLEFANTVRMLDANINWKINDYLALMVGQYKIPFSLENQYNPNALEMIDNSLVITHLVNYADVSGIATNGRDIGISLNGNFFQREGFSLINYSFGVFNGSGINRTDDNKNKDFSGTFSVNPFRHLTLAVSHYNGTVNGQQNNTFQRVRNGLGVKYDDNRLLIRSGYIHGKTDDFKSEGTYAVVGYFVHSKVQAVARYDYFKRDLDNDDTRQLNYAAGVNYLPVNNIRLQFNYTRRTQKDSNYIDNNYFVTQLWIRF